MAGSNFRASTQEGTPRRKNELGSGSLLLSAWKDDLCLVVPPAERGVSIPTRPPA